MQVAVSATKSEPSLLHFPDCSHFYPTEHPPRPATRHEMVTLPWCADCRRSAEIGSADRARIAQAIATMSEADKAQMRQLLAVDETAAELAAIRVRHLRGA